MIKAPYNRLGKKSKILNKLQSYFPKYDCFVEPFAGTGVVGLNSGAKYVFLNDLDGNVFDTWQVLLSEEKTALLVEYMELIPYSDLAFDFIKKLTPANEIEKVAKFLVLSNWGYMGMPETLSFGLHDPKHQTILSLKNAYKNIVGKGIKWACKDFRAFIRSIPFRDDEEKEKTFIYCDPPYLDTKNNYNTPKFTATDLSDLVECCIEKKCKFAISEFENETILALKEKHSLFLYEIGERQNMKNRRAEILLTNYEVKTNSLFKTGVLDFG